jgi:hypothetical protein
MALARAAVVPNGTARSRCTPPHTLDQLDIGFDDTHAVASTGLLPATLAERLGSSSAPIR